MIEEILCKARRQIRSIVNLCEEFGVRRSCAKFTDQNFLPKKSSMIEEILCDVRRQIRSIVNLCEEFDDRHTRTKFTDQNDFFTLQARLYIPAFSEGQERYLCL